MTFILSIKNILPSLKAMLGQHKRLRTDNLTQAPKWQVFFRMVGYLMKLSV
jgi:hypothetical protein